MKLSLTEQLLLGILSEHPNYGYNIEKIIEMRDMRKWTDIGFSSIYYILDKLAKKGLAAGERTAGKEKKRYSITKSGLKILKDETKKRIAQRMPANTHLMTGLVNSRILSVGEITESLKERKLQLERDLAILKGKIREEKKSALSALRLFRLSKKLIIAELHWINEELGEVKNEITY